MAQQRKKVARENEQLKNSVLASLRQSREKRLHAQSMATMKAKYIGLIQSKVRSNWSNQTNPDQDLMAILTIKVSPYGQVLQVRLKQSSGNSNFDQQAILAVKKSSPLPLPNTVEMRKDFSTITLPFSNLGSSYV